MSARRKTMCSVCKVTIYRFDKQSEREVCFRPRCNYFYTCERESYWRAEAEKYREEMGKSNVSDKGVHHRFLCKSCSSPLPHEGCGVAECKLQTCALCLCEKKECKNAWGFRIQNTALERQCGYPECTEMITTPMVEQLRSNEDVCSMVVCGLSPDGENMISGQHCQECRDSTHFPAEYCVDHAKMHEAHVQHWAERLQFLPNKKKIKKKKKRKVVTEKKKKNKKVRVEPIALPPNSFADLDSIFDNLGTDKISTLVGSLDDISDLYDEQSLI